MEIKTVGLVGLGLLGRGIAACLLGNGLRVVAYSRDEATREPARRHIEGALRELVEHGQQDADANWSERYIEADSFEALREVDFVIESIIEDFGAKLEVYDELEAIVGDEVPICSNTSALPISLLQQSRRHPERFVGMHWGEPCHVLRFMEIIRGAATADAPFEATVELARRLGKQPSLVEKDMRGFVTNRLFYAMLREAFHLLESGVADIATIDRSFRNDMGWWSTLAGPFRFLDLTGIPAYAAVAKELFPELCNDAEVPRALQEMADAGARGVGNAKGFYEYTEDEAAQWSQRWHDFTWDIRGVAEKYVPLDES